VQSVNIAVGETLELRCRHCHAQFQVAATSVSGREALYCPFCGKLFSIYDGLPPDMRRRIYHAIRNLMEQRIHEQRRMNMREYFEDEANLPPA
jgi:uncharacterized protein YbaR (Trm112 family)